MTALLRFAVVFLILANVLFYAWSQGYLGREDSGEAHRLEEQIFPERIKAVILPLPAAARDEESKTVGKRTGDNEFCRQWGDLASADADQIERVLGQEFTAFRASRKTTTEVNGYWVYVPPLASRDDASRKAAELEQLGVQEFFVVTGGPNQLAISLGTYRSEAAANARLEALRAKGVKSARVGERKGKPVHTLEIRGPEGLFESLHQALAVALPKLGNPVVCQDGGTIRP